MKTYLEGKKLNKIEQNKAKKDGLKIFNEIEKFAEIGWENMDKTDLELRLKWFGLFWRPKTPGKFMLRLRVPNGILNSNQLKVIASIVSRYGENGRCDITTRQNLQLRGVLINDFPEIIKRLKRVGIFSTQSGFDNPRNITGNPLAGIDPNEIIDTRPYIQKLNSYLIGDGYGNEDFSNLPRKWNTAIAGSTDNFLLHNDLVFLPSYFRGSLGFSIWVGGILSSVLNAYAEPLDVWIEEHRICEITSSILKIWRNNGERSTRQKGRFRIYLNSIGINNFRDLLVNEIGFLHPDPGSQFIEKPRSLYGIHPQKQEKEYFAGIHIPVGRLNADDLYEFADISENLGDGDIRLTEDQNLIISGIHEKNIQQFKLLDIFKKFSLEPGKFSAGTVSCTGNTYCNFALTNTKDQAIKISEELDRELSVPEELKIHWTGCPNSCGQAYMGAIGLTGKKAKNSNGEIIDAYDISLGGSQGAVNKIADLYLKAVPINKLKITLKKILIEHFDAVPRNSQKVENKQTIYLSNFKT
tara:strand:- start:2026 stop:3600 length:1575 start_codon:yes stop_codon:yes gene_type:complete